MSAAPKEFQQKKILVVDDEDDLREIARDEFELHGAKVFEAPNGRKAWELLAELPLPSFPDLVMTDLRMPGGDGLELLTKITEHYAQKVSQLPSEEVPDLPPVLLVTGFSDLAPAVIYSLGAAGVLQKPYNLDDLVQTAAKLLVSPQDRWAQPVPENELNTLARFELSARDWIEAQSSGIFQLGRLGAFLGVKAGFPKLNQKIQFELKLEHAPQESGEGLGVLQGQLQGRLQGRLQEEASPLHLSGTGTVRWIRADSDSKCFSGLGLEFCSLNAVALQFYRWVRSGKNRIGSGESFSAPSSIPLGLR
jgi:CheY-like chemotaxis protein